MFRRLFETEQDREDFRDIIFILAGLVLAILI